MGVGATDSDVRRELLDKLLQQLLESRRVTADRLHDEAIPAMVAASLRLHALRRRFKDPKLDSEFVALEDCLQDAVDHLRDLLQDIAPGQAPADGLAAELRSLL